MFAVKGWAVDAGSLKPQTEPFKTSSGANQNGEAKQARKRKRRGEPTADAEVQDVGKLWDKHIESKKESSKLKRIATKERKRQKLDQGEETSPTEDLPVDAPAVATKDAKPEDEAAEVVKKTSEEKQRKKKDKKAAKEGRASEKDAAKSASQSAKASMPPAKPALPAAPKLTPMQAAMRQKLISARFRHLNETLYTEPSAKALELFGQNPDMFEDYHSGFRQQVSVWPENPVDNFIATIRERGKVRLPSQKKLFKDKKKQKAPSEAPDINMGPGKVLPRTKGTSIIADLGCGDARLAQTLKDSGDGTLLNLKVLSYDLHSPSPLVTKADISSIPTADNSVDVAIFCLALMGTNWISFIEEAYRILHWKGELWIAEIKSRFGRVGRAGKPVEHSVGGKRKEAALKKAQEAKKREQEDVNEQEALAVVVDGVETKNEETDVSAFIEVLRRRGFVLKDGESSIDPSNRMFVKMEFNKAAAPTKGKGVPEQRPQAVAKFKPKAKFLDEHADDVATDDEAKVLKPCLYKIR